MHNANTNNDISSTVERLAEEEAKEVDKETDQKLTEDETESKKIKSKQTKEEHNLRVKVVKGLFKWIIYFFAPVIVFIFLVSGVQWDAQGLAYSLSPYATGAFVWGALASVVGVSALILRWVFRAK